MLKTFSGRKASQDAAELAGFIGELRDSDVRSYCEIGARHGDTFHAIMLSLPAGSRGVAVDLPGGLWGKAGTQADLNRAVVDLCRRGYRASAIYGDSHADATRSLVVGRGPYDALLIDGDHTLAGVTRDWLQYGRLAKLVAFHDIVGTGQKEGVTGREVQVPELWKRIRARGNVREFISPGSAMGIGVVWMA